MRILLILLLTYVFLLNTYAAPEEDCLKKRWSLAEYYLSEAERECYHYVKKTCSTEKIIKNKWEINCFDYRCSERKKIKYTTCAITCEKQQYNELIKCAQREGETVISQEGCPDHSHNSIIGCKCDTGYKPGKSGKLCVKSDDIEIIPLGLGIPIIIILSILAFILNSALKEK